MSKIRRQAELKIPTQRRRSIHHLSTSTRRRFVVHSLRRTRLPRLCLPGVDAFTIMKFAGHSSIVRIVEGNKLEKTGP